MQLQGLVPPTELPVPFKAGQAIFKEGDQGDFMYVLLEGTVEVVVHDRVVGAFEPVEVFGEMALIDPRPRSASVIAKTDCKLVRINRPRFLVLVQNRPEFALQIMQMLVDRIRWMDSVASTSGAEHSQEIEKLREENKALQTVIETQKMEIESLQQKLSVGDPAGRL